MTEKLTEAARTQLRNPLNTRSTLAAGTEALRVIDAQATALAEARASADYLLRCQAENLPAINKLETQLAEALTLLARIRAQAKHGIVTQLWLESAIPANPEPPRAAAERAVLNVLAEYDDEWLVASIRGAKCFPNHAEAQRDVRLYQAALARRAVKP